MNKDSGNDLTICSDPIDDYLQTLKKEQLPNTPDGKDLISSLKEAYDEYTKVVGEKISQR